MSRHLESERNRLRTALGDILRWVDQNVHPASQQEAPTGASAGGEPAPGAPAAAPATVVQGGNRPAAGRPRWGRRPRSGAGPSGEVTQMRPAGSIGNPPSTNAPLPL